MKKNILYLLLIASASFYFPTASAQTAEQIIEKHLDAMGGIDNFKEIKTLEAKGQFTAFSLEQAFVYKWFNPNKYYFEYSLGKHDVREAYNSDFGWVIDPWMNIEHPRKVNATQTNVFMQKAALFSPFFTYKQNASRVEYLGKETVEGVSVHALKMTRNNEQTETWYLDADSYLPYKYTSIWQDFTYPVPCETFFDDYKTVAGMQVAHYTERVFGTRHRVMVIENIRVNPETNTSITEMPRSAQMQKLAFMSGQWNVEIFLQNRSGEWQEAGKTSSEIQFSDLNKLQETIMYERFFVTERRVEIMYSASKESYFLGIYNGFDSEFYLLQGEMSDTTLIFDDTKLSMSEAEHENQTHRRYLYSGFEENAFELEIQTTNNGGETWNKREKFKYTRAQK